MNDGPHIVVDDLGNAPAGGGTPVSLQDSDGNVLGRYAQVIDAYHAKALHNTPAQAGASGAYDDMDSMPDGTPVPDNDGPHMGPDFHDDRTPSISTFAGAYGVDPELSGGAAGAITTPQYTKVNTTPFTQHWTQDEPASPANIGNPEANPLATSSPFDNQTYSPLTHPVWKYPHDVNP